MTTELDILKLHAAALGVKIWPRTAIVEGTSDVEIFGLAARLERARSGIQLLDEEFGIVAAGEGDQGGVNGVVREFLSFRALARTCLLPNGRPKYRFSAFLDNDEAGRRGVKLLKGIDTSVLEFRDVYRLHPVMPFPGMLDPKTVEASFSRENGTSKGLDWELEDLISDDLIDGFESEFPGGVRSTDKRGEFVHREWTRDGKARLIRYTKDHAICSDLERVIAVLRSIRYLAGATRK